MRLARLTLNLKSLLQPVFIRRTMACKVQSAERIEGTKPSIWVIFSALSQECGAVNIGQGFPDYAPPSYVMKAVADIESDPSCAQLNQYTRSFGHVTAVKQLAKLYNTLGMPVDAMTDVLITVGAYHALFYTFMGYLNPGDEAIIIEPFYDCYEAQIRMAGGVPVYIPLRLDSNKAIASSGDMRLDFDELESKFSAKTKLLVLNNPHNPTGKVYTKEELLKIAALAKKHDVIVVADEVYEWMVYEPNKMHRFATLPDMWERTITIGSAGKTFSVTGWKLGWAIGPERLLWPLKAVHQNCVYTCPTVMQEAVARSFELELARLDTHDCYFRSISSELRPKRDFMARTLASAGLRPIVPDAGYFMMADYSKLNLPADAQEAEQEHVGEPRDFTFARWLCRKHKLAGIPPTAFYSAGHASMGEDYIRFCFFKKDDTLKAAEKILKDLTSSLS